VFVFPAVEEAEDTVDVVPAVELADVLEAGAGGGPTIAGHVPVPALGHAPQTGAGAVYVFVVPHVNPAVGLVFAEDPPQNLQHCMSIICCLQFFHPQ